MSLWPLYIIGAAFVLYTINGITVHLWEESMRIAAEGYLDAGDLITNITPQETPLMRNLKGSDNV